MISQHDTESAILDPPLRSLICDPQIIIHDVATAVALDLRTIRQRDSGEEVKSVTCIDEILISFMWSGWRRGRRSWEEKLWVSCVPRPSRPEVTNLFKLKIPDLGIGERQDLPIEALRKKDGHIELPTCRLLLRQIVFELHEMLWTNFQMDATKKTM